MTDSAQGGGSDKYQPFSDARGGWMCTMDVDGPPTFTAVLVDFTFPTEAMPEQRMARVDIVGHYDEAANTLTGETKISFYPMDGDPLDAEAGTDGTGYTFTGEKIVPLPH